MDGRVRSASHVPAATGNALATLSAIGWEPDGQLGRLEFLGGALTVAIAYDAQTLQIASTVPPTPRGPPCRRWSTPTATGSATCSPSATTRPPGRAN